MSKKRKPSQPRALPPEYSTGSAERAATANDRYVVEISHKYDLDKPVSVQPEPYSVIHDRVNGTKDSRKGMTQSAVHDEVRRRNAGLPVSAVSQGIGRKPKTATPAAQWVEIFMSVSWKRAFLQRCIANGTKLSLEDIRELRTTNWNDSDDEVRILKEISEVLSPKEVSELRWLFSGSNGREYMPQWLAELGARPLPSRPTFAPTMTKAERATAIAYYEAERDAVEREQTKLDEAISKQLLRVLGIERKDGSRRNDWKASRRRGVSRTET